MVSPVVVAISAIALIIIIVVVICVMIGRAPSASSTLCMSQQYRPPCFQAFWYGRVRMKEAFDKLVPKAFIVCLIYPILQGPKVINVNCVDILKQKAQVLNHEISPVVCGCPTYCLWSQHTVIMFRDSWSGGPWIIFPMKSVCQAAIMFCTHGIK
jgi:hypothetical protein